MKSRWLFGVAILVGLTGCKTAEQALLEQGIKPMHEAQMREEFVGNTLYGETQSGRRWIEYIDKNGTVRSKWVSNGALEKGTWTINEYRSCFSYEGSNAGIPLCYTTYKTEDDILAYKDNKSKTGEFGYRIYRVVPGNVESL